MLDSPLTRRPEHTAAADDAELARVLEQYLSGVEAGRAPSAAQLLAAHPHLAERLEGCLASLRFLEHAGGEVAAALHPPADEQRAALGDFRIVRELGRGGMGVVYEAEQLSLGRRVALKVLPFAAMLDERQLARFKNEARAAASLHHPHIVPVYFVGADRGVHYYAMQYIEGPSLARFIEPPPPAQSPPAPFPSWGELERSEAAPNRTAITPRRTPPGEASGTDTKTVAALPTLPVGDPREHCRTVARLGVQAAEALHYAHQSGIVHRDVKPSNLLVECSHLAPRDAPLTDAHRPPRHPRAEPNDHAPHLWVADFGLARTAADPALTMTGDLVGTLRYMSPEQVRGKTAVLDHRTDVYSLGVTLYELLVRRPAFDAVNADRLLRQVVDEDPPAPRSLDKSIPADLETIVLKAICKEPAERYATAQDLADDLRRFLGARPIVARRPTSSRRIANWIRRNPQLSLAIGVSAVLLTLVASLAAWSIDSARRDAAFQRAVLTERDQMYQQAETSAREQVYAMRIHFAGHSAQTSYTEQAAQALNELMPAPGKADLRGFEWHYLARLCGKAPQPFGQHQGEAYAASFSPDESRLATAGADGVRIWAWPERSELVRLREANGDVNGIAWSPDGAQLASFSEDCTARIYRTADWTLERSLPFPGRLVGGHFTPDGKMLLIAERKESVGNGATIGENRIHIYDTVSWQPRGALDSPGEMLQGVAVSSDGQLVAAVAYDSARIWDLPSRRLLHRLPQTKSVCVAFARNSPTVAVGAQGEMRLYDAPSGKLLRTIAPVDSPEGMAFGPDDRSLITVGRTGVAYLWRQAPNGAWHETRAFPQYQPLWSVAVARDGQFVATDRVGGAWAWDVAASPEARHVNVSSEFVERWLESRPAEPQTSADYAAAAERWADETPVAVADGATAIAWSPAGDEVAIATHRGQVSLWDAALGQPRGALSTGMTAVGHVAWSPDGRWIAVSAKDALGLVERETMRLAAQVKFAAVGPPQPAFSRDGETLFVVLHRVGSSPLPALTAYRVPSLQPAPSRIPPALRVPWRNIAPTETELSVLIEGPQPGRPAAWASQLQSQSPIHLTLSADHGTAALVRAGGIVDVIRASPWQPVVQVVAGASSFDPRALAPNGRTLAILSPAGRVALWSAVTGRQFFELHPRLPNTRTLRFSPDGERLVAIGTGAYGNPELVIWDATPAPPAP